MKVSLTLFTKSKFPKDSCGADIEVGRVEEASAVDACRIGKERGEEPAGRLSDACG